MIIVHYLKCRKENDDELFKAVRKGLSAYGLPQEEVPEGAQQPEKLGPFSIRLYLRPGGYYLFVFVSQYVGSQVDSC